MTDAYVTQLPALGLYDGTPAANITQLPALVLYEIAIPAHITQLPVLVLYGDSPCVRQVAQCWRITRTDGTVLGFTTHDEPITALGTTFESCDSLRASAAAYSSNAEQIGPGDIEMTGIISADGIKEEDLYGGLYDGARVEVFEIAWDGSGTHKLTTAGVVANVTHGGAGYVVAVQTGAAKLTQQPLITTYTAACRHVFGDSSCTIALGPLTVTGTVTTTYVRDGVNRTSFRRFADSIRTEATDYFTNGVVTWTSGANTGVRSEVKSFDGTIFELWDVLPNEIALGDAYSLTPGCPKTVAACQSKWGSSNIANFGGFPHLPGKDVLYQTPDSTS